MSRGASPTATRLLRGATECVNANNVIGVTYSNVPASRASRRLTCSLDVPCPRYLDLEHECSARPECTCNSKPSPAIPAGACYHSAAVIDILYTGRACEVRAGVLVAMWHAAPPLLIRGLLVPGCLTTLLDYFTTRSSNIVDDCRRRSQVAATVLDLGFVEGRVDPSVPLRASPSSAKVNRAVCAHAAVQSSRESQNHRPE